MGLYALLNPALVLGLSRRKGGGEGWRRRWWRKKEKIKMGKEVEAENDLPWVL